MNLNKRWVKWSDKKARAYCTQHNTSVAPVWLYGKTPYMGLRMLLSEQIRKRGTQFVEAISEMVWPWTRN